MLAEVTTASKGFLAFLGDNLHQIIANTGFANVTSGHLIMIGVGLFFLYLAISRNFEPMLLVPIGFGILVGNIPFSPGMEIGIYEDGSVLNYLYFGVIKGIYPPLIFLGIGAMTDFSALISNPKLMLVGAAAQIGIFATYMGALALGFTAAEAGAIGIIGGADGPTAIFLTSKLAPDLLGAISISAYSYMALVPVCVDVVFHLHRFEYQQVLAGFHLVAFAYFQVDDNSRQRALHSRTGALLRGSLGRRNHLCGRGGGARRRSGFGDLADLRSFTFDLHFVLRAVHGYVRDVVLHAVDGNLVFVSVYLEFIFLHFVVKFF